MVHGRKKTEFIKPHMPQDIADRSGEHKTHGNTRVTSADRFSHAFTGHLETGRRRKEKYSSPPHWRQGTEDLKLIAAQ
jgi:hypothetical protein